MQKHTYFTNKAETIGAMPRDPVTVRSSAAAECTARLVRRPVPPAHVADVTPRPLRTARITLTVGDAGAVTGTSALTTAQVLVALQSNPQIRITKHSNKYMRSKQTD